MRSTSGLKKPARNEKDTGGEFQSHGVCDDFFFCVLWPRVRSGARLLVPVVSRSERKSASRMNPSEGALVSTLRYCADHDVLFRRLSEPALPAPGVRVRLATTLSHTTVYVGLASWRPSKLILLLRQQYVRVEFDIIAGGGGTD